MVHRDIVIRLHGKTATLAFTDSALTVSRGAATDTASARSARSSDSASRSKSDVEVPLRNVLGAEFDEKTREIVIHFVSRKKKNGKGPHVLVKITGAVKDAENYTAKLWVDNLLQSVFTCEQTCLAPVLLLIAASSFWSDERKEAEGLG